MTYLLAARRTAASHAGRPFIPVREVVLYLSATLAPLYSLVGFSPVPLVMVWWLYNLATDRHDVVPTPKTS